MPARNERKIAAAGLKPTHAADADGGSSYPKRCGRGLAYALKCESQKL